MPYLEVEQGNQDEIEQKEEVHVPNITGLSIKEAEKNAKELGLEIQIDEEGVDKEKTIIQEQIPKEGIKVNKGSKIFVK